MPPPFPKHDLLLVSALFCSALLLSSSTISALRLFLYFALFAKPQKRLSEPFQDPTASRLPCRPKRRTIRLSFCTFAAKLHVVCPAKPQTSL